MLIFSSSWNNPACFSPKLTTTLASLIVYLSLISSPSISQNPISFSLKHSPCFSKSFTLYCILYTPILFNRFTQHCVFSYVVHTLHSCILTTNESQIVTPFQLIRFFITLPPDFLIVCMHTNVEAEYEIKSHIFIQYSGSFQFYTKHLQSIWCTRSQCNVLTFSSKIHLNFPGI